MCLIYILSYRVREKLCTKKHKFPYGIVLVLLFYWREDNYYYYNVRVTVAGDMKGTPTPTNLHDRVDRHPNSMI